MKSIILAIDPGSSSGAITWYDTATDGAGSLNMPDTFVDLWRYFEGVKAFTFRAVMEQVGATRPGNSAKSAHTFAEHCGALKMAILAAGIPLVTVVPQKWMRELFEGNHPTGPNKEDVARRKQYIYEKMQEKFPRIQFTKRQADSVALLAWAMKKGLGSPDGHNHTDKQQELDQQAKGTHSPAEGKPGAANQPLDCGHE